jgi:hypothetical protein
VARWGPRKLPLSNSYYSQSATCATTPRQSLPLSRPIELFHTLPYDSRAFLLTTTKPSAPFPTLLCFSSNRTFVTLLFHTKRLMSHALYIMLCATVTLIVKLTINITFNVFTLRTLLWSFFLFFLSKLPTNSQSRLPFIVISMMQRSPCIESQEEINHKPLTLLIYLFTCTACKVQGARYFGGLSKLLANADNQHRLLEMELFANPDI